MSTLVERLEEMAVVHERDGQTDPKWREAMYAEADLYREAAAALRATGEGEWEYYYRQSDCPAVDNAAADCVCWHPEGTGPFANEQHDAMDSTLEWRRAAPPPPLRDAPTNPGEISSKVVGPLRDAGAVAWAVTWPDTDSVSLVSDDDMAEPMYEHARPLIYGDTHPAPAQVDEAVDWRGLYRFTAAMRYMDNNPSLSLGKAEAMAEHDCKCAERDAAAAKEVDRG